MLRTPICGATFHGYGRAAHEYGRAAHGYGGAAHEYGGAAQGKGCAALRLTMLGLVMAGLYACSGEEGTGNDQTEAMSSSEQAGSAPAQQASAGTDNDCSADGDLEYICGLTNAEDLVRIGETPWLLASGMDGALTGGDHTGHLYLINSEERSHSTLFPAEDVPMRPDTERFAACPGPVSSSNISIHGLSLRETDMEGVYHLYMTAHGEREAIEVFTVDTWSARPQVHWAGCVPMPESAWTNSVAILDDGGFVSTQFIEAGESIEPVEQGEITGHVFEWHPGADVEVMPDTEMSGANGIVVDEANDHMYVAEYGQSRILRYSLSDTTQEPAEVAVDSIHPDNLRWTDRGTILTAGGNLEGGGWSAFEIDPADMTAERIAGADGDAALQGVSVALEVDDELWFGTYGGDRVGIMPAP